MGRSLEKSLGDLLGGIIAAQTGMMQGRQHADERRRRQQNDEQDNFFRLVQLEGQQRNELLAPWEEAVRASDPNAPGFAELFQSRPQLPERQYGPANFPAFGRQGQRQQQAEPVQWGGGGAPQGPDLRSTAVGGAVAPAGGQAPSGGVQGRPGGMLRPVRRDPALAAAYSNAIEMREKRLSDPEGLEEGEASKTQGELTALYAGLKAGKPLEEVFVVDEPLRPSLPPTKANRVDQTSLEGQRKDTQQRIEAYIALGGPKEEQAARAAEVGPILSQLGGLRVGSRAEADTLRTFLFSPTIVDLRNRIERRSAEWERGEKAKADERKRAEGARAQESEWKRLDGRLRAAQTSKNPKLLAEAVSAQLDFLDKHPEFEGKAFEGGRIDPRPQKVTRSTRPGGTVEEQWAAAEGTGPEVGMIAVDEMETPKEAQARTADELGSYFLKTDPDQALKLKREAVGRLMSIARDKNVSEAGRLDALRRVGAITQGTPGMEGAYPTTLKLEDFTPQQQYEHRRNLVLDKERVEKNRQALETHNARMSKEDLTRAKMLSEASAGVGDKAGKKAALDLLNVEYKAALEELGEVEKIPAAFRGMRGYDARKAAAEKALKETKGALTQAITSGDAVGQLVPSRRGPKNELGFNAFQMKTIKLLQGSGLSFEEAANEVRRRAN